MTIYIFIYILILGMLVHSTQKTVLIYFALRFIFHTGIAIRYEPPMVTLDFACCLTIVTIYIIKGMRLNSVRELKPAIILFCLSYILAAFFSTYPLISAFPPMFGKIISLLYCCVFIYELSNYEKIRLCNKAYVVVMLILISYGLYEYYLQENPIVQYQSSLFSDEFKNLIYTTEQIRMGSVRCQSLAAISITYGTLCVIFATIVFMFWDEYKSYFSKSLILYGMSLVSVFCAFTTGSKSPFIFLITFIIFYIFIFRGNSKIKTYIIIACTIILLGISNLAADFVMQVVDSGESSIEGSDIPMRLMQLDAVCNVVSDNWLFGLGAKGVMRAQILNPQVLGAESIWFQLILEQGLIGIVVYLIFFKKLFAYSSSVLDRQSYSYVKIFSYSWLAVNTVSSLPGLDITHFICLIFLFIRHCELKNNLVYHEVRNQS